jgi:hypothetical protein
MNKQTFFLLVTVHVLAVLWGCATSPSQPAWAVAAPSDRTITAPTTRGGWRYERSITNSAPPRMPPDSERSRWVTRMEH